MSLTFILIYLIKLFDLNFSSNSHVPLQKVKHSNSKDSVGRRDQNPTHWILSAVAANTSLTWFLSFLGHRVGPPYPQISRSKSQPTAMENTVFDPRLESHACEGPGACVVLCRRMSGTRAFVHCGIWKGSWKLSPAHTWGWLYFPLTVWCRQICWTVQALFLYLKKWVP